MPEVARRYYEGNDAMEAIMRSSAPAQRATSGDSSGGGGSSGGGKARRRKLTSLYDVFLNVRDDEAAHWDTLVRLVNYASLEAADGCEVDAVIAAEAA